MNQKKTMSARQTWTNRLLDSENYASLVNITFLVRLMSGIAIALPLILWLGRGIVTDDYSLLASISEYYHSNMGDVFVGLLFTIGVFLIAYKGFALIDNILATIAGIAVIGVALIPTCCDVRFDYCPDICATCCSHICESPLHFISAGIFLTILMIFCLFIFTKNNDGLWWRKNGYFVTYYASGLIMLICLISIFLYSKVIDLGPDSIVHRIRPIFWLESIALWVFGISWIAKSMWIKEHHKKHGIA